MAVSIHGGIGRTVFDGISRIYAGGELVALMDASGGTLIARDLDPVLPVIVRQPAILPADAALGDTVTLDLGLAEAYPAAAVTWTITRDGVSVATEVDPETMALVLAQPGTYALAVDWTNAAGTTPAEAARAVIAQPVPDAAPGVLSQPAILPADAGIGDTVTLDLGMAQGSPAPDAGWTFTRDGQSLKADVDPGTMTVTLTEAGTYTLGVEWNNRAGQAVAEAATLTLGATAPADSAPVVTRQPSILPEGAKIGDTITLDLGAATGQPAPVATWDLRRDGVSIRGSVDAATLKVALPGAGTYVLSVTWTSSAGSLAANAALLTVAEDVPPDAAPQVTEQPSIQPAGAVTGDTITLHLGTASGLPAPTATWDLTRDGVSIHSSVDAGALTMELPGAGTYALSVTWTNRAGSIAATNATLTVQAPPVLPALNYDTQTLAYFDAATSYNGSATDVTAVNARGTGGYVFQKEGTGTTIKRSTAGFVFASGCYLQTANLAGQPTTDGLFAVVDCTLASYGSTAGQIVEGAGGHVKLRDNSGRLQVVGQDDSAVGIILGLVAYGSRVIVAGLLDDVLNVVGGINIAGADVSAAHSGVTDPELTRLATGRYVNGTIHRLAIVGRAEGQAWPVTMREIYQDFQRGA